MDNTDLAPGSVRTLIGIIAHAIRVAAEDIGWSAIVTSWLQFLEQDLARKKAVYQYLGSSAHPGPPSHQATSEQLAADLYRHIARITDELDRLTRHPAR